MHYALGSNAAMYLSCTLHHHTHAVCVDDVSMPDVEEMPVAPPAYQTEGQRFTLDLSCLVSAGEVMHLTTPKLLAYLYI